MNPEDSPFAELPAAMVDEVLQQMSTVGEGLLQSLAGVRNDRADYRAQMLVSKLIVHESELGYPSLPTTCATDGSYAVERLLTTDLAVAAAVAVEGLTPPSERRHWEQPHHSCFIASETHHSETSTVLRAVMLGRELVLARNAPHDLVMLDGTMTLPIIYFNQALSQSAQTPGLKCSGEFLGGAVEYLSAYATIVESLRSDKDYVALPKYSTRREIGKTAGWPVQYDDRALLTLVLHPGELTKPMPLEQPSEEWHLGVRMLDHQAAAELVERIVDGLKRVYTFYYKPHAWMPALRVEVARDAALNHHRLAVIVQGLKHQCAVASMLEPYPQYLADRTVKALSRSIPAFRQVATQHIAEHYAGDVSEVFLAMHGYRTETGR